MIDTLILDDSTVAADKLKLQCSCLKLLIIDKLIIQKYAIIHYSN